MNDLLTQRGVVRAIDRGAAVIAVAVQGCASCGQKKSCGVGKLAGGARTTLIRLPAHAGLAVGDVVTLQTSQRLVNRSALLAYLLPATLLVGGTIAGGTLAGDAGAAIGALAGLAIGLAASRLLARFHRGVAAVEIA